MGREEEIKLKKKKENEPTFCLIFVKFAQILNSLALKKTVAF